MFFGSGDAPSYFIFLFIDLFKLTVTWNICWVKDEDRNGKYVLCSQGNCISKKQVWICFFCMAIQYDQDKYIKNELWKLLHDINWQKFLLYCGPSHTWDSVPAVLHRGRLFIFFHILNRFLLFTGHPGPDSPRIAGVYCNYR